MLLPFSIFNQIFNVSVPAHYAVLSQHFSRQALFGDYVINASRGGATM